MIEIPEKGPTGESGQSACFFAPTSCIGAVLFLGGLAALQGSKLGRVVGIVAAALAAISEFFMIPYSPVWSIIMLVLYVIVLCAFVGWRGPRGLM